HRLAHGEEQLLLEEIVALVNAARGHDDGTLVVEGLVPTEDSPFTDRLNALMARALDAELVLVGVPEHDDADETARQFALAAKTYGDTPIAGCILNKVREVATRRDSRSSLVPRPLAADLSENQFLRSAAVEAYRDALADVHLEMVGAIPMRPELAALRVADIAERLDAQVVRLGDLSRRVIEATVIAKAIPAALPGLHNGALVIVPADRHEILMAAALRTLEGDPPAALLLTGHLPADPAVLSLCSRAVDTGMSILAVAENTLPVALAVMALDSEVPVDDRERAELVMNTVANHVNDAWLRRTAENRPRRLSPPAFRHRLIERARAALQRIVLPEGEEPRTVAAAITCQERGIAQCLLIGDRTRIAHIAADQGLRLPDELVVIAASSAPQHYVEHLYELRKHKGVSHEDARLGLEDPIVQGTMMLYEGDADGLVSGAIHTTADTLRPALQIIKTAPGKSLVSSVFFMCLPDQVLVYGDCAVNPDPDSNMLADIAIQSAESALAFGIEPRVALISYSTGASGSGSDVEKVAQATALARERRPDLLIDGPLQYDAAVMPEVAAQKAPKSAVAGRATVLVFPDLNTGNTTYKAVQRSAHVVSMGPMLQGLARPVNDLSRGCLVEDIVYTIALTAIQAQQARIAAVTSSPAQEAPAPGL
ncbi:MAG TPA: phosphate acetyltransferase, partial [Polyangiaceae bacterium]|nr:phosphate acetyltransferase [Polyangiaceae bacterium]